MKKNKFYSSLLAVTLVFSAAILPVSAYAEEIEVDSTIQTKKIDAFNTPENPNSEVASENNPQTPKAPVLNQPEITVTEIAPGLTQKVYKVLREEGPVSAYFLEADKELYTLLPALDHDLVPGRDVVSAIANEHGAVAAVNASYFSLNGEILGVTKINGQTTGTTYFRRTALGVKPDGSAHIGKIAYDGYVTLGGVTLPISGVDAECGENGTVIYNKYYGKTTNTNIYVTCYVIKDDKVTFINPGNTEIPEDGVVVAVHGKSKEAYKDVQIGDDANIFENLGDEWNYDTHILGVGPQLVKDGEINVTAKEEEFPSDIRYGRNPRAGFAITREGNYLFAVVDGRQKNHSIGATLTEFAQMFADLGAYDAMNFDGGASAELLVQGKIINSPSAGYERKIGNALLLMEKTPLFSY